MADADLDTLKGHFFSLAPVIMGGEFMIDEKSTEISHPDSGMIVRVDAAQSDGPRSIRLIDGADKVLIEGWTDAANGLLSDAVMAAESIQPKIPPVEMQRLIAKCN